MFTGVVEEIGWVLAAPSGTLMVKAGKIVAGSHSGDSIAVNGVCLTATTITRDTFSVDIMPETRRLTNLGGLRPGDPVDLERAMVMGGRLGGHLVQGHIDGMGKVMSIVPEEEARLMKVGAPSEVLHYVVKKGFIAVDGASLTVVSRDSESFTVSLVGFTWNHTILGQRRSGDAVNLEVDIIAKYVAQYCQPSASANSDISMSFLREHGF
jgi:riboflavin synthase